MTGGTDSRDRYLRAHARWQRAMRYEGRRPRFVLDLIRLRALSAMIDARNGR